ncbi:hypothetical protein Thiowin_03911 [Thiorhodovibrio winogradskyi]|uniref:Uncharacterized protein n=1 Tax=Thiorhodovibrio winogradskyi TaxID=77007 RepID=A0ABZ0SGQ7_9GAMM|nr:hypothetical protein [Thiorhodovibrio winogradskyi]
MSAPGRAATSVLDEGSGSGKTSLLQTLAAFAQQRQHLGVAQTAAVVGAFEQGVGGIALVSVEFEDAFRDAVLGDQAVDGDLALLADAVGAIRGLILDRWVPSGVHVNHRVGGGEVEPRDAGALQLEQTSCPFRAFSALGSHEGSMDVIALLLVTTRDELEFLVYEKKSPNY